MALADEPVGKAVKASQSEVSELLRVLPGWALLTDDGIQKIERKYAFSDFTGALAFVNNLGALAEAAGHHPEITFTWGRATVRWWTHYLGGLTRNDFIMAAKTDTLKRAGDSPPSH